MTNVDITTARKTLRILKNEYSPRTLKAMVSDSEWATDVEIEECFNVRGDQIATVRAVFAVLDDAAVFEGSVVSAVERMMDMSSEDLRDIL